MDIGKDVLTKTLLGSTESEKVFTPWWITAHHYLVYSMVICGKNIDFELITQKIYAWILDRYVDPWNFHG